MPELAMGLLNVALVVFTVGLVLTLALLRCIA